ncbi:hypothetical protein [Mesorhizobium sp.]|uniref:hypothetical protein n=1 Tax=Mesorhizobium sp. TaxID=1871066 RepID=UPI000FE6E738|nr:hypothetical protein [Mesorhizobium sp.]RWM22911.1 MAG: hypothetical protein EOR73_05725 [Mesorhizobium sp.]TIP71572.1 MAG: hypothetical protein E5X55_22070 [Mesorhizobium sp.]TJV94369.1 MAG: hypothetical protein E5X52_29370 [Mesorhizobium sp.]
MRWHHFCLPKVRKHFAEFRAKGIARLQRVPNDLRSARSPNTLVVISRVFDIVTAGGIQMAVECASAPHMGVFSAIELDLLRGVVREVLRSGEAELDNEDAEMIARVVIATYKDGASGREELLEAARIAARRCALDHFYDRAVGLFA